MTLPTSKGSKGIKPEWRNLPRRKCDDCGKSYKPGRPLRETDKYGFCSPTCKKSFHKHGGAYRKLKGEIEKLISRRLVEIKAELYTHVFDIVREEIQRTAPAVEPAASPIPKVQAASQRSR